MRVQEYGKMFLKKNWLYQTSNVQTTIASDSETVTRIIDTILERNIMHNIKHNKIPETIGKYNGKCKEFIRYDCKHHQTGARCWFVFIKISIPNILTFIVSVLMFIDTSIIVIANWFIVCSVYFSLHFESILMVY